MVEAVMFWNEPNNLSHWDFELDPDWKIFGDMVRQAANAVKAETRDETSLGVLQIVRTCLQPGRPGVLDSVDVGAVHGFPSLESLADSRWPDNLRSADGPTFLWCRKQSLKLRRCRGSRVCLSALLASDGRSNDHGIVSSICEACRHHATQ